MMSFDKKSGEDTKRRDCLNNIAPSTSIRDESRNVNQVRRFTFSGLVAAFTGLFGVSTNTASATVEPSPEETVEIIAPEKAKEVVKTHEWVLKMLSDVDLVEAETASNLGWSNDSSKPQSDQSKDTVEKIVEKPDQEVIELEIQGSKGRVGLVLDKDGGFAVIETPESVTDDGLLESVHRLSSNVNVPRLQDTAVTSSSCNDGAKPANQIDHPFNDCYIEDYYDGGSGCMEVAMAEAYDDFGWGSLCQCSSCYCENNCLNGTCNSCQSKMVSIPHPDYDDRGWLDMVSGCCPDLCYGPCAGWCHCSSSAVPCDGGV